MNCWITTHWPVPATDPPFSRHVYVKTSLGLSNMPQQDDIVFVYETKAATVNGGHVQTVALWTGGTPTGLVLGLPIGASGIIGKMTVSGNMRTICDDDVVLDYGNLRNEEGFLWQVIPCHRWDPVGPPLPRDRLMEAIGKARKTPPRFLRLWRVPENLVPPLVSVIEDHLRKHR